VCRKGTRAGRHALRGVPAIEALASAETSAVAVLDGGEQIVGLVTPADIQRVLVLTGAFTIRAISPQR
jgi:hypothetical protein